MFIENLNLDVAHTADTQQSMFTRRGDKNNIHKVFFLLISR